MSRIVVIGIGNAYRRDDGAGLEVARRIAARVPTRVDVVCGDGEPAALLDLWEDTDLAVVVDTVRSGSPPGTVHVIDLLDGSDVPHRSQGTHGIGVAYTVELGRRLGRLPGRLVLVGIEGRDFGMGRGLSPAVRRATRAALHPVLYEVARALRPPEPEAGVA